MVLTTYLKEMAITSDETAAAFRLLLREVLDQPLADFDAAFTEEAALKVAAGVFFFGRKSLPEPSDVVPAVVQDIWRADAEMRQRIPSLFDLGRVPNVMLWAKDEGRRLHKSIDDYFNSLSPFQKRGSDYYAGMEQFNAFPIVSPDYLTIPEPGAPKPGASGGADLRQRLQRVAARSEQQQQTLIEQNEYIQRLLTTISQKDEYIQKLEAIAGEGMIRRLASRLKALSGK
jgi:hypothetical protein